MNVQNSICSSFCSGLSVREIPLGYAIKTPFSWLHGEPLVVFGEVDRDMVRMRDSGDTLMFLEDVAGDLTMDSRIDAMREIALEHGVQFDEDNALFVSDWVDKSQLGDSAVRFMSFLNRLQDVALLHKERATSIFREELIDAVRERFEGRYHVGVREPISADHREYTADLIVRAENVQAAIYAATTDVNVLEALLAEHVFSKTAGLQTIPIVVFENFMQSKVSLKTRRRAMNSARLQTADWSGGADEVLEKIEQQIAA